MNVDEPEDQLVIGQGIYNHGALNGQWLIERQTDGYYTIQTECDDMGYLGISNISTGVNNIQFYDSVQIEPAGKFM